ncbi:TPA: hypothetical protein DIV45_00140 [Patescibacteria group bacterium]|nr:hypothetical protein [Patescibacteria group bacterium]
MFPISNGVNKIYSQFISESPVKVARGVKLSRFCTMKVGGPADLLVEAKTKEELVEALKLAHKLDIPYFVLAGGSNVVFPDTGFRGLVVRYVADKIEILKPACHSGESMRRLQNRINQSIRSWTSQDDERVVEVEAGMMLGVMVQQLLKQNWGGFNFLANIPGSVGGAIVGNAGCYGKEIKDVLEEVEIFNVKTGKIMQVKPSELGFDYRHSKLKHQPELIVLSAILKVIKVNSKAALKEIAEEKQVRLDKHPQSPSCGSWFKNPARGIPAWKFIDQAGLRGHTIGGARISNKHSNFLVNCGGAKTRDIVRLVDLVKTRVQRATGIKLQEEAKLVK